MSKQPDPVKREFDVFQSEKDEKWYWHAKSPANGEITFSGQGHPDASKAVRAIKQELTALGATEAVDIHVKRGDEVDTTRTKPRTPKQSTYELLNALGGAGPTKEIQKAFIESGDARDAEEAQEMTEVMQAMIIGMKDLIKDPVAYAARQERMNKPTGLSSGALKTLADAEEENRQQTIRQASTDELLEALNDPKHLDHVSNAIAAAHEGEHEMVIADIRDEWNLCLNDITRVVKDPQAYHRAQRAIEEAARPGAGLMWKNGEITDAGYREIPKEQYDASSSYHQQVRQGIADALNESQAAGRSIPSAAVSRFNWSNPSQRTIVPPPAMSPAPLPNFTAIPGKFYR